MTWRLGGVLSRGNALGSCHHPLMSSSPVSSLYARVPREARGACARFDLREALDTSRRVTRVLPSLRRRRLQYPH